MLDYTKRKKTPILTEPNTEKLRKDLLLYFQQTWKTYQELFKCIKQKEGYYFKSNHLRHPLIFYYGHTATFYVNKLVTMKVIPNRINENLEAMFAIGVDEMSWDDLNEEHYDWPSVETVQAYRDQVYHMISELIQSIPITSPIEQHHPAWLILMGIEHENIHIETSSVLIRELPLDFVQAQANFTPCDLTNSVPNNELLTVTGETVNLAKKTSTYGWDNEYGHAEISVKEFKASKYLVSNHQFKEFLDAGGYEEKNYWTEEGWQWCQSTGTKLPYFWRQQGEQFFLRTLTNEIAMPWDWPAEVNYYEAKAFCNYLAIKLNKPIRLPTEAEWQVLARSELLETQIYPNWDVAPANIDLAKYASPCPVTQHNHGRFYDVIGNVWQWTETPIYAFSGFQVHPAYDDFSVPTFDEQHHLFKGGSSFSCGNEALLESRYAFRKHFFQSAGIRYVESTHATTVEKDYYESDALIGQYLELHYGAEYFSEKNFMVNLVETIMKSVPADLTLNKALDLGCAVGRGCFELARYFSKVDGVDFSTRFIQCADKLLQTGKLSYAITTEGELTETKTFNLADLSLPNNSKVHFLQGDACNLHQHLNDYDLIIASNLIDRLYEPNKFLQDIKERLNPGGVLAITSPYTWLEEHTNKENWLGGYKNQAGDSVTTLTGLTAVLENDFERIAPAKNIPFVIRETARKFQHSLSELTIWRKKAH